MVSATLAPWHGRMTVTVSALDHPAYPRTINTRAGRYVSSTSAMGRESQLAGCGSCRTLLVILFECRRGRFGRAADIRSVERSTPGLGTMCHSDAGLERQQSVWSV